MEESKVIQGHLAQCAACRKQAAFSNATRICALTLPTTSRGPACLSDEALCLYRDGALTGQHQSDALAHLSDCSYCLDSLVNLDRALEESAHIEKEIPRSLVERALAATVTTSKNLEPEALPSWLQRLLQGSLFLRLATASAVAGLVMVLVLLFGKNHSPVKLSLPSPEEIAKLPTLSPTEEQRPAQPGTPNSDALAKVENQQPPPGGNKDPSLKQPLPNKNHSLSLENVASSDWIGALSPEQQQQIHSQVRPAFPVTSRLGAQAFEQVGPAAILFSSYWLGQGVGYLKTFARNNPSIPEARKALPETAEFLSSLISKALQNDPSRDRISNFATLLAVSLNKEEFSPEAVARRVEVLDVTLNESLSTPSAAQLGYRLGKAVDELKLLSAAQSLQVPHLNWKGATSSIQKTLELSAKDPSLLPGGESGEMMLVLKAIGQKLQGSSNPQTQSLLKDIQRLDQVMGNNR